MALSVARAALALAASLAVISTADAGSVIGIDFGSENLKIALVKPGVPLDIVRASRLYASLPPPVASTAHAALGI
jgi:molecular chaperone DnaK (HSP70)